MSETISQRELRNESGAIMRRVELGESFIVTRNGQPVADLLPHNRSRLGGPRRFVAVADIAEGLGVLPGWGVDGFASELTELDELIDDRDREPWAGQ